MEFSHPHRTLCSLASALACAVALLGNAPTALAGFLLSGDEAVVARISESSDQTASNGADDLAAYLPAVSEDRQIDLSIASTSGAGNTNGPTRPQKPQHPLAAEETEAEWLTAFSGNSASHAGGASTPNGSTTSGTPAAILAANQTITDLQVTGWLQDASQPSWPKSMPRTLLRPPRV